MHSLMLVAMQQERLAQVPWLVVPLVPLLALGLVELLEPFASLCATERST